MGRAGGSGGHRTGGGSHRSSGNRSGGSSFRSSSRSSSRSSRRSSHGVSNFNKMPINNDFNMSSPPPPQHRSFFSAGGYNRYNQTPMYDEPNYVENNKIRSPFGIFSTIMGIVLSLIVVVSIFKLVISVIKENNVQNQDYSYTDINSDYSENIAETAYKTSKGLFYEDHLEMQLSEPVFNDNMQTFRDKTGVNPFVYTCQKVNGTTEPTSEDLDILYKNLGLIDSVLLVYQEYGEEYGVWVYVDDNITVEQFPDEFIDKITNYVVDNYEGNMTNAELFSRAFLSCVI